MREYRQRIHRLEELLKEALSGCTQTEFRDWEKRANVALLEMPNQSRMFYDLCDALITSGVVDYDAIHKSTEWDMSVTLARVSEVHRKLNLLDP